MKYIGPLLTLALTGLSLSTALAQSPYPMATDYYAELGLSALEIKDNGPSYNPTGMRLILGKNLNPHLAVEGIYAFTVSSENEPGFNAKSSHYSIGLKPKVSLNASTDLFARLGYARSYITGSVNGAKSVSDWTYGLGVQTKFTESVYGQLDYTSYADREGAIARAVGFSVGMRFY